MSAATRLVNAWLAVYTAGLPAPVRTGRRDEVRSDMWEHRSHAESRGRRMVLIEADILLRCLRGTVADITWRCRQHRGRPLPARLAIGFGWASAGLGCAVLVVVPAGIAAGYVLSAEMRADPRWVSFLVIGTAIFVVELIGMALAVRHRRIGLTVVGVGLWSVVVVMAWAWPVVVPAALASSGGIWRLARRPVAT